ncbi:MAG: Hpt domain-containing protein, partial [Pseudomonadota bacterium]|nr:Hpt domain-containing protein [Pseudomonadota bacterium]
MSVLRDAMDHATLGWIRPELDAVLLQVRQEVESQIEDGADPSGMRAVAAQLHQVQGSLKMVELYAPAMAAGEMELLALALADGATEARDEACAVLMRGAMQLPDYLERLQGGHRDIPIVLMPLINDLRAARGMRPVSEAALFSPELDRPLPGYASEPAAPADQDPGAALVQLRDVLDNWNSGRAIDAASLHDSLAALAGQDISAQARRLLWVAKDIAAALRDQALLPSSTLRDAFASVEREARGLFADDDHHAQASPASLSEPTRQLLFHAASSHDEHPSLQRLRESFALGNVGASEDEIAHARASVSGRNRALLDTVAAAVKEDVLRIKDALDLHLRTGRQDAEALAPQVEALTRVADTLGMLGLGAVRDLVAAQAGTVDALAKGTLPMSDGPLLDVAGALLYVDASLDDQVALLGEEERSSEPATEGLGAAEAQNLLDALTREAIANFGDARQGFVGFIETGWDHGQLGDIPRLLHEVTGALRMLGIDEAADYVTGIQRYTEIELIGKKRVPGNQKLDTLADAMSSVEYYLEALREQRGGRDDMLAIARHSLELLHYWPVPDANAVVEDAPFTDNMLENAYESWLNDAARADLPAATAEIDLDAFDLDYEAREQAAAKQPQPASSDAVAPARLPAAPVAGGPLPVEAGGFDLSNDEIDDEIREIFLEEFSEEIQRLDELMPVWKRTPEDVEALRPIRRVFHTLKGSGRLVGARRLGEFSWKIENMLNRVLDGTRPPSEAVIGLVAAAQTVLPRLHGALLGVAPAVLPLAEMEAVADRLVAGEEVNYVAPAAAELAATEPVHTEVVIDQTVDAAADAIEVTPMVGVAVDAVLLEILGSEVDGHLSTIDGWLDDADQRRQPPSNAVLRAVHTMNGAFAMAEVPEITDATAPAESWLKRLVAAGQPAGDTGIDVLRELGAQIRATIGGLQNEPQQVPMQAALKARFEQL